MRKLLIVLSWYTLILIALEIVFAPIALDDTAFSSAGIVVGSILALPVLIYAILVIVYLRRKPDGPAPPPTDSPS